MRALEFHFNPKEKSDIVFDSFCFDPENAYEKRVGSLYMAGLLKNVLPQNAHLLDKLARIIRERYYKFTLKNPEKALRESLKAANDFLEDKAKKGDVSWLGNLNFAALSLKDFELNFTKVGEMKILLLRKGHIIDIDKRLQFQDLEPYPLKIFPNIISGKLSQDDLILTMTKGVFAAFQKQGLIADIANLLPFEERLLKNIVQRKSEALSQVKGTCLFLFLSGGEQNINRQATVEAVEAKTVLQKFSFQKIFRKTFDPLLSPFKKAIKKPRWQQRLKFPKLKIKLPRLLTLNKKATLILALSLLLTLGYLISQKEEGQKLKSYQIILSQSQQKLEQAKSLLPFKETNPELKKRASIVLNEALIQINYLNNISATLPDNFRDQVFSLRQKIENELFELNKLVRIETPELFFEADPREFIPQKMASDGKNIYLFTPYEQKLLKISSNNAREVINSKEKISQAANIDDAVLFFSKPDKFLLFQKEGLTEIDLPPFSSSFYLDLFSSFKSNLYFLDKQTGEIIKYGALGSASWQTPQPWLFSQTKKPSDAKSFAVNGSIWIISKENKILRYFGGYFQETLNLDIFPQPKEFSKILAVPPYLYILEPAQSRVIVISKSGEIIKQFQSHKFDNLLDFFVTANGKTIYLLNSQRIYRIDE